jgi:ribonuclease HII
MRRALNRLTIKPDHVIIDGKAMRTLPIPHTAIIHGDARCFSIACASIVAKVTRDRLMARLARRYPAYTWERNVGYTTRAHIRGLDAAGITPHHRRSFFRVSQLMLALDASREIVDIVSDDHDLNDDVHMLAAIDLTIAQDITPDVAQQ